MLSGPSTDFPVPPTYIGPSSDEDRLDVLSEGTEAYEDLPIWEQIALGVTPVGVMADLMMAAKYGRDAIEDVIASRYGDAAVAATMTALATVGFIPGVGDALKAGSQKLLRGLGVPSSSTRKLAKKPPKSREPLPRLKKSLKDLEGLDEEWKESFDTVMRREGLEGEISFEEWKKRMLGTKKQQKARAELPAILKDLERRRKREQVQRTYPTGSKKVVDLDQWHGIRREGIENLVDPRLYKQRRWLFERYGITDADLAQLSKKITDYEGKGNVIGADFSKKLTPQDIRSITGLPGGRKMEPWHFPDDFKNAGGEIDDESERFELGIDWRDPVDEDWPLKDRDFYEIRGQMVWPWEVEGFLKRIAEEEEAAYGPVSKSHKAIEDTIAEKGIASAFKQFQKNEAGYAADDTLLRMQDLLDEQLVQDEDLLSDLQLEHAGRDLSDQDVLHVLTQQGLTVEEAMRFLSEMSSDSSRSWEDMLESFLASLREEDS